jgi:hypothetical protein
LILEYMKAESADQSEEFDMTAGLFTKTGLLRFHHICGSHFLLFCAALPVEPCSLRGWLFKCPIRNSAGCGIGAESGLLLASDK